MRFRERLRLHFRKQKPLPPRQQNANQRLWEQYRKLKGEEGLTLIDETGNDIEPEQARTLLRAMLYERWSKAEDSYIPAKREATAYLDQPPHTGEIEAAIKAINKKAATGLDGIPARRVNQIPIDDLQQFIRLVWINTKLPRQLVDMKVKPIPKSLPRTTVGNTRPITIPSTVMKIINQ
ncbi:hypothetical protein GNI_189060, partial [Gregarina niphandrodes]